MDLRLDYLARERLDTAAEAACHALSNPSARATLSLPFVAMDLKTMQPLHLDDTVSGAPFFGRPFPPHDIASTFTRHLRVLWPQLGRAQFAHVARAPLAAIANVAAAALAEAGLSAGGVVVLLVGGGARSAAVVDAVRARVAAALVPSAELVVVVPAAPEEAVVLGAALAAKAGWVS